MKTKTERIQLCLTKELASRMREVANATGMKITTLVERAVEAFTGEQIDKTVCDSENKEKK